MAIRQGQRPRCTVGRTKRITDEKPRRESQSVMVKPRRSTLQGPIPTKAALLPATSIYDNAGKRPKSIRAAPLSNVMFIMDTSFEESEIEALKHKIAELENKLQETESNEERQVQAMNDKAEEKMKRFSAAMYTEQGTLSGRDSMRLVLDTLDQSKQLEANRKTVRDLRADNKSLRLNQETMMEKTKQLQEENARLEAETATLRQDYKKLSATHEKEEQIYADITVKLPRLRHQVQLLRKKSDRRSSLLHMERNVRGRYAKCVDEILSMTQRRSSASKTSKTGRLNRLETC